MKRLMIITAVFALLLTGCGTRVSHDTLIELSVSSITEYQIERYLSKGFGSVNQGTGSEGRS